MAVIRVGSGTAIIGSGLVNLKAASSAAPPLAGCSHKLITKRSDRECIGGAFSCFRNLLPDKSSRDFSNRMRQCFREMLVRLIRRDFMPCRNTDARQIPGPSACRLVVTSDAWNPPGAIDVRVCKPFTGIRRPDRRAKRFFTIGRMSSFHRACSRTFCGWWRVRDRRSWRSGREDLALLRPPRWRKLHPN